VKILLCQLAKQDTYLCSRDFGSKTLKQLHTEVFNCSN
jgi:hypothetical protein